MIDLFFIPYLNSINRDHYAKFFSFKCWKTTEIICYEKGMTALRVRVKAECYKQIMPRP